MPRRRLARHGGGDLFKRTNRNAPDHPLQTKQAIVHGAIMTLFSLDGSRWFSDANELVQYERQRLAYARKLQGLGRKSVTLKRF